MSSRQLGGPGLSLAAALSAWHQFPWRLDAVLQNVRRRRSARAAARLLGFLNKHLDHVAHVSAMARLQGRGLPLELRQEHAQMRAYLDVMKKSFMVWGADEHMVWVTGRLLGNCLVSHTDKVERALWEPVNARANRRRRRARASAAARLSVQSVAGSLSSGLGV